jgi:hypothetical protein
MRLQNLSDFVQGMRRNDAAHACYMILLVIFIIVDCESGYC